MTLIWYISVQLFDALHVTRDSQTLFNLAVVMTFMIRDLWEVYKWLSEKK